MSPVKPPFDRAPCGETIPTPNRERAMRSGSVLRPKSTPSSVGPQRTVIRPDGVCQNPRGRILLGFDGSRCEATNSNLLISWTKTNLLGFRPKKRFASRLKMDFRRPKS